MIQQIMQSAQAHIYGDRDDVIYAAWNIISIHTKEGGKREIRLRNDAILTIDLPRASTTLMEAETGEILN